MHWLVDEKMVTRISPDPTVFFLWAVAQDLQCSRQLYRIESLRIRSINCIYFFSFQSVCICFFQPLFVPKGVTVASFLQAYLPVLLTPHSTQLSIKDMAGPQQIERNQRSEKRKEGWQKEKTHHGSWGNCLLQRASVPRISQSLTPQVLLPLYFLEQSLTRIS